MGFLGMASAKRRGISAGQRFTAAQRCPVCGGCERDPRGQGVRCTGYLSSDGEYAHCSREDRAGAIEMTAGSQTFAHRLRGACRCGVTHGEAEKASVTPRRERKWEIRDAAGLLRATHVRIDDPKGKRFVWQGADGAKSLNGIPVRDLPLYGSEALPTFDKRKPVVITEGEKAADALRAARVQALGTVTGAGGTPSRAVLAPLKGFDVVLWPDADADTNKGPAHMKRIAAELAGLGCRARVVSWPEAPDGGDAADCPREIIPTLINAAAPVGLVAVKSPETTGERGRRSKLVRAGDLQLVAPRTIVRGIFEADSFAQLFGESGSAKTFWTISVACCIATGTKWFGRPVKKGPVVYIPGEGHAGVSRRIRAWSDDAGISIAKAPLFVRSGAAALLDPQSLSEVLAELQEVTEAEGPPVLIILDTVARNFGPGDENATPDMSAFVRACDTIRTACPNSTVLVVHHSGWASKDRGRGNGALKAALDAEYKIEKAANDLLVFSATKMKDAAFPKPIVFKLRSVELPGLRDEDGLPVTSAVLDEVQVEPVANPTELLEARVLRALSSEPSSVTALRAVLGCNKAKLVAALASLEGRGEARRTPKGWQRNGPAGVPVPGLIDPGTVGTPREGTNGRSSRSGNSPEQSEQVGAAPGEDEL